MSNKAVGPPVDRDGTLLVNDDGTPKMDAQPPFLLRYSPQLFAKECPELFAHDPETNRLWLHEDKSEPWLRERFHVKSEKHKTWLYCIECFSRYFNANKKHGHIPYRDKASQGQMKTPAVGEPVDEPIEEEPEVEPALEEDGPASTMLPIIKEGAVAAAAAAATRPDEEEDFDDADEENVDGEAFDEEDSPQEPSEKYPTLEEYQALWDSRLAQHSRANPGEFNRENLVPEPISQLWQDLGSRRVSEHGVKLSLVCERSKHM